MKRTALFTILQAGNRITICSALAQTGINGVIVRPIQFIWENPLTVRRLTVSLHENQNEAVAPRRHHPRETSFV